MLYINKITHDECHFYANDGQRRIWIGKNEDILRPKGEGRSIMVSAFLCPCHGLLRLSDEQIRANPHIKYKEAFILRSIQSDGYWKSEHMLEQLVQQAIPIFEVLHPGCVGVFCFDQSTNHNAMAENALVATKMNLGPGGVQSTLRDGWYINENGENITQPMIFPNDYEVEKLRGVPKGIKQVLTERKLWPPEGVRLVCEKCAGKNKEDNPERLGCCARRIISQQPDFCEQKSILEEAILEKGHIFERYPKFHCECNFIERYWGYVKRETRKLCKYNYTDLLQQVPKALVSVPVSKIRKFARKSWRYMDAYNRGLEGRIAEWAVNKYKTHRRLPENVEKQIDFE